MNPSAALAGPPEARLTEVIRVDARLPEVQSAASKPKRSETQASARAAEQEAPPGPVRDLGAPPKLLVEIDVEAGRFVNTLLDPQSEEVIRKYPSEAQLAYSRAVRAYMRAMSGD